jgi:hypothetical protein
MSGPQAFQEEKYFSELRASSVFSRLPAGAASATLVGASLRIRSPSAIRLIVKREG